MLALVETYFLDALKAAFPSGASVTGGPFMGPSSRAAPLIEIVASALSFAGEGRDEPEDPADPAASAPAYITRTRRFASNGKSKDFALPADEAGEVIEVQSPPGLLRARGDDYLVEGKTIRFYTAPAKAAEAVVARLRGARARGYERRRPCVIDLCVRVWAEERARADELSRKALAAVLTAAPDMGVLDASDPTTSAVSVRLLRADLAFSALRRGVETKGALFHYIDIELRLRGQLEQIVALGESEQEGIIREVRQPDV